MPAISSTRAMSRWPRLMIGSVVGGILLYAGWMVWAACCSADLWKRAQAAAGREDWERTAKLLDRLSWYNPDDRKVLRLKVEAALGRGDLIVAAGLLSRVPATAAEAVEARLTQGRLLIQAFLLREAEAAFRECIRLDPKADEARLALIAILAVQRRRGDYETEAWALLENGAEPIKALRLLAQAAPAIPPDTFTRTADMGDVLRRCVAADPGDPNTRVALAHFERGRGRVERALRLLESCLLNPESRSRATLEWADCLLDDGELERLRPLFEHPDDSLRRLGDFWILRGEWARREGREVEALDNYREAIRMDPRSSDAYYRLGLALREAGPEADRCLEVSQKARDLKEFVASISDRSRDPGQLVRAGRLCAELGRYREARAWFTVASVANPAQRRGPRGPRSAGLGSSRSAWRWAQDSLAMTPSLHLSEVSMPSSCAMILAGVIVAAGVLAWMAAGRFRPSTRPISPPSPSPVPPPAEAGRLLIPPPKLDIEPDPADPRFRDVAADVGLTMPHFNAADGQFRLVETMGSGVGLIDYDGDGWLDVFVAQGCPLPPDPKQRHYTARLYRNRRDGTFADVTDAAGVGFNGYGEGVAVGDYDGDGREDIYISAFARGPCTITKATEGSRT